MKAAIYLSLLSYNNSVNRTACKYVLKNLLHRFPIAAGDAAANLVRDVDSHFPNLRKIAHLDKTPPHQVVVRDAGSVMRQRFILTEQIRHHQSVGSA